METDAAPVREERTGGPPFDFRGAVFYDLNRTEPSRLDVFSAAVRDGRGGEFWTYWEHGKGYNLDERAAAELPLPALSSRQREILTLVAAGQSYKEVAAALNLSEHTVKYHMGEILDRLHLESREQVVAYALRSGLAGDKRETR